MDLKIDPTVLDGEDIGQQEATLRMDHEDAIEHVREVFTEAGFGVPAEFSPSELLNKKVDADRDPYYVLGACHPAMADRALNMTPTIGALFPCNVVIWESDPGVQHVYHVSIMRAARLLGMAPDTDTDTDGDSEQWDELVRDTGELVDEAFERLDTSM